MGSFKQTVTVRVLLSHFAERKIASPSTGPFGKILSLVGLVFLVHPAQAQLPPGPDGYIFPAGGKVGSTVEVHLGGSDWTPDVQFVVHNPPVKLEVLSKPGPVLMHEPPFWFGARSSTNDPRLPREVTARFVLPADLPPGPIHWSVVNANGGGTSGVFHAAHGLELNENETRREPQDLPNLPLTVNGRLRRIEEVDEYRFKANQTGPVTCDLFARRLGSDFRGVIEIRDADGKRLADKVDTDGEDPTLVVPVEKGKSYTVAVRDLDFAGYRNYIYRLKLTQGQAHPTKAQTGSVPRFQLKTSGIANVPIGAKASLTVNIVRAMDFKEPVKLEFSGLPEGITVPGSLVIPPGVPSLVIPVECARTAGATASLVQIHGTAKVGETIHSVPVFGEFQGDISARDPNANMIPHVLLVTTLKPPFKVRLAEADGGRRIPRGSTHLTEVLIERTDGFTGELLLDMAGAQQRHRQGIQGPPLTVLPGQQKVIYPVFLPEWLETTRTSRLGLVAMGRVCDPKGVPRFVLAPMEGQITMSIEGALMKLSAGHEEITATPGKPIPVVLHLARSPKLTGAVQVDLIVPEEWKQRIFAKPFQWPGGQTETKWMLETRGGSPPQGTWQFTARATTLREGHPVVSEAPFEVEFLSEAKTAGQEGHLRGPN